RSAEACEERVSAHQDDRARSNGRHRSLRCLLESQRTQSLDYRRDRRRARGALHRNDRAVLYVAQRNLLAVRHLFACRIALPLEQRGRRKRLLVAAWILFARAVRRRFRRHSYRSADANVALFPQLATPLAVDG